MIRNQSLQLPYRFIHGAHRGLLMPMKVVAGMLELLAGIAKRGQGRMDLGIPFLVVSVISTGLRGQKKQPRQSGY